MYARPRGGLSSLLCLVLLFVPFMRDAVTHEHDEDPQPWLFFVRPMRLAPAEHVIARAQIVSRDAHAALEHDDRVPAHARMLGLTRTHIAFIPDTSHTIVTKTGVNLGATAATVGPQDGRARPPHASSFTTKTLKS